MISNLYSIYVCIYSSASLEGYRRISVSVYFNDQSTQCVCVCVRQYIYISLILIKLCIEKQNTFNLRIKKTQITP